MPEATGVLTARRDEQWYILRAYPSLPIPRGTLSQVVARLRAGSFLEREMETKNQEICNELGTFIFGCFVGAIAGGALGFVAGLFS